MDRRQRGGSRVTDALAQLKSAREGGIGKRAREFEVKEQEAVYDVVEEDEYSKIVEKRRNEGGDFVVDDAGLGYMDVGEEDDWFGGDVVALGGKTSKSDRKKKSSNKKRSDDVKDGNRRKQGREANAAGRQRMQRMFANASARQDTKPTTEPTDEEGEALLADILKGLDEDKPQQKIKSNLVPSKRTGPSKHARNKRFATVKRENPFRIDDAINDTQQNQPEASQDFSFGVDAGSNDAAMEVSFQNLQVGNDDDDNDRHDVDDELMPMGDGAFQPQANKGEMQSDIKTELPESSPAPREDAIPDVKMEESLVNEETPTKPAIGLNATPRQSIPGPSPSCYGPTSGWQEVYNMEPSEKEGEEKPWVDDGSLPITAEGNLPFYIIDAVEDALTAPGQLFLFGKIPCENSRQHVSCCGIVQNVERILYVIPKEGTFEDKDGKIAELELEASRDPDNKGKLVRHLQEMASDVKAEVRDVLIKHKVTKFRMKPVKRNYAFEEKNVPHGEQYVLKVYVPGNAPLLPLGLKGEHFAAIFGTNQSLLDSVLVKRGIKGPSWITLKQPVRVDQNLQRSWCSVEVELSAHKAICPLSTVDSEFKSLPIPTIKVAALNLKTYVNPASQVSEIVLVSVVHLENVKTDGPTPKETWNKQMKHFTCVSKLRGQPWPSGFEAQVRGQNATPIGKHNRGEMISIHQTERALLGYLLYKLKKIDPDVLVGHNITGFDLSVLLQRMKQMKVSEWSRIGRLKRRTYPNLGGGGQMYGAGASPGLLAVLSGRLICDTYLSARELVKEVDYTLTTLSKNLLGQHRYDLSIADITRSYDGIDGLSRLIAQTESDAWLSLGLMFHLSVLPLTKELTVLSGSVWNKTLQGQRAQRIEMLLMHNFHKRKFILPDKMTAKERAAKVKEEGGEVSEIPEGRKKAQYAGGLVLEPKKGLYDKIVLLLDFNSLYPSIIQEYNICFTTVSRSQNGSIPELPESSKDMAPLPTVIRGLVQRRRRVKNMMKDTKDPVQRQRLDIHQQALKLTANSMYGCLGFSNSRFFCKPLAELITFQGREILQSSVDLVQGRLGLEVVYGDTDSIMINTHKDDFQEAMALGLAIKKEVNKHYRLLEIDIDGIYKPLLLLKKKKYAAVKVESHSGEIKTEIEQKGLDIVRRDWCPLSKDAGNFALGEILSGKDREEVVSAIHNHLRDMAEKLENNGYGLGKFIITKQLTKNPNDYPDAKNQPHVMVAIRRREQGKREATMQGETVPYVICTRVSSDGTAKESTGLAERAFHPEEVRQNSKTLRIDKHYYLAQQIHPCISRLCAPIEGTDEGHLAECLGLDSAKFKHNPNNSVEDGLDDRLTLGLDDREKFKDCDPLLLKNPNTGTTFDFCGVHEIMKGNVPPEIALTPPDCTGDVSRKLLAGQVANQAVMQARKYIAQYYDGWMCNENDPHAAQTRDVKLEGNGHLLDGNMNMGLGGAGVLRSVYDEKRIYLQLSYLHHQVDVKGAISTISDDTAKREAMRNLGGLMTDLEPAARALSALRSKCQFGWVSLPKLFPGPPKSQPH